MLYQTLSLLSADISEILKVLIKLIYSVAFLQT